MEVELRLQSLGFLSTGEELGEISLHRRLEEMHKCLSLGVLPIAVADDGVIVGFARIEILGLDDLAV